MTARTPPGQPRHFHSRSNTTSSYTSTASSGMAGGLLARPTSWLRGYDNFITRNAGQVSQLESALRSLTYIIPGRFRDAEIASEALHSAIQLLSLYHDTLLQRAVPAAAPRSARSTRAAAPTPHTRYTRFWTARSPTYRRAAVLLQAVAYTQLLCEMAAKRRGGERSRWRVVVVLEVIKALCRLVLLRITRGRALVAPPLPEREPVRPDEEPNAFDEDGSLGDLAGESATEEEENEGSAAARTARAAREREWAMPRTGTTLPPLPNPQDITSYLLSRVLTADDIKPATALLNRLGGSAQAAEMLHILAPVAYAVALAASPDKRSWAPWIIGLSIELAARQLHGQEAAAAAGGGARPTALEREEWARRGWGMGWWAMRGPFYDGVVKGIVDGIKDRMPGFVGGIVQDYEYLWENYHFSTA